MINVFRKYWELTAVLFVASVAAAYFWPASYWYSVESVLVSDAPPGMAEVTATRVIHNSFPGQFTVEIRRVDDASNELSCYGHSFVDYTAGSDVNWPKSLDWWVNNRCVLEPGSYHMVTTWTIKAIPFMPKEVQFLGPTFHVVDPDYITPRGKRAVDEYGVRLRELEDQVIEQRSIIQNLQEVIK